MCRLCLCLGWRGSHAAALPLPGLCLLALGLGLRSVLLGGRVTLGPSAPRGFSLPGLVAGLVLALPLFVCVVPGPSAPLVLAGVRGRSAKVCLREGCWGKHLHAPRGRGASLKPEVTSALGVLVH